MTPKPLLVPFLLLCSLVMLSCSKGSSTSSDDNANDTASAFQPPEIKAYDDTTLQADTRIACDACGENGVFVRIHFPKAASDARYSDNKSPIVISVPGGLDNSPVVEEGASSKYFATGVGMTTIYFNLPGSGNAPYDTGGDYDERGSTCQQALGEVLLFSLGKKTDLAGRYITDIISYADTTNVGVIGLSNGGNLAVATLYRYGTELNGISYYVGYENPAADEYVLVDLGGVGVANPTYTRGNTIIDPIKGSVSTLDPTDFRFNNTTLMAYFDLNQNNRFDAAVDYGINYWESGGIRYYSTEILTLLTKNRLITFPHPLIAEMADALPFWDQRDMSLHTTDVVSTVTSLKGAIIVGTEQDHVQFVPGYPHIVVNYMNWSGLSFVRLNPDADYAEYIFTKEGMDTTGLLFSDNPAGAALDFYTVDAMLEPEKSDKFYNLAAILEMADRVHVDDWTANLTGTL